MSQQNGMYYAPKGKPNPVCKEDEFFFSVAALDHGHIYGMTNGLVEAGATLKYVYDPDPQKVADYVKVFPQAIVVKNLDQLLMDNDTKLVAAAAITSERCALGLKVMDSAKDYFTDKAPFTTLEQLESAEQKVAATGKKYMVYFSERLHVEGAVYAGELIKQGAIGKVIQVLGLGPHRLSADSRPDWFFKKDQYGGILCDIGSHQIEQYLFFADVKEAQVVRSQYGNYNHPQYPELDDFGEAMLVSDNGATNYFRVDWFTPNGLSTWGDGRTIILGTEGYIEIRKYIDIARDNGKDHVYLVDKHGAQYISVQGKVGFPFFGQLIMDCINRTETAMTQQHAFKAAKLSLQAQNMAVKVSQNN